MMKLKRAFTRRHKWTVVGSLTAVVKQHALRFLTRNFIKFILIVFTKFLNSIIHLVTAKYSISEQISVQLVTLISPIISRCFVNNRYLAKFNSRFIFVHLKVQY